MHIAVRYDGRDFPLEEGADVGQLQARIKETVETGGGMVYLDVEGGAASILVTPETPVAIYSTK
ncbi:hypothetical protein ACIB24_09525 [Spongisporangium articulatum]|uniref:Uncharacterized protein n=1 Tax=Spongisporangium articulatum TaxID=3362603 RepID=A0ABW8ALP8_9ACTN